MPTLLSRVQAQNETWFTALPPSTKRVRGVLQPTSPNALPTSVFILPRLSLRTRVAEPVRLRDLLRDPWGRIHLVGDHDATLSGDDPTSRLYALFQMTHRVSWMRREETLHPVTKQPQAISDPKEKGPIWASIESYTHTDEDPGLRITTDRLRCITNADLQLGDLVRGKTVKRINQALGVTVAEIE